MNATLNKWYQERGRHLIYAGNKDVNLPTAEHSLVLNSDDVRKGIQTDLDEAGIAKNARDEKRQLRRTPEDERMEKMYREQVLNEQIPSEPQNPIVQIDV